MVQNIIVAIAVISAIAFLTKGLWLRKSNCSKGGCGCSGSAKTPKS